jgi:hypothetical protein
VLKSRQDTVCKRQRSHVRFKAGTLADCSMVVQIVWGSTEQNQSDNKIRVDMPLIIDGEHSSVDALQWTPNQVVCPHHVVLSVGGELTASPMCLQPPSVRLRR